MSKEPNYNLGVMSEDLHNGYSLTNESPVKYIKQSKHGKKGPIPNLGGELVGKEPETTAGTPLFKTAEERDRNLYPNDNKQVDISSHDSKGHSQSVLSPNDKSSVSEDSIHSKNTSAPEDPPDPKLQIMLKNL